MTTNSDYNPTKKRPGIDDYLAGAAKTAGDFTGVTSSWGWGGLGGDAASAMANNAVYNPKTGEYEMGNVYNPLSKAGRQYLAGSLANIAAPAALAAATGFGSVLRGAGAAAKAAAGSRIAEGGLASSALFPALGAAGKTVLGNFSAMGPLGKTLTAGFGGLGGYNFAQQTAAAASPTGPNAPRPGTQTPYGNTTQAEFKAMQDRNMADVLAQSQGRQYISNMQLSPAETLAYDQAIEQLRRSAGQASATSALAEKQSRAQAGRNIGDIRAFTSGAGQDVLSSLASAGMGDISAGGMGAARGLAAREATGVGEVKQSLADYLAKQRLAAGQRGSDVSYGVSAIEAQREAELQSDKEAARRLGTGN